MAEADDATRPLRLIVQQAELPSGSFSYRLVVYGHSCVYNRSDFDSLAQLREIVRSVLPELEIPAKGGTDTKILFSTDLDLSAKQLRLLGVL